MEHSEDPDIDDPILEHTGGALGTASSTPAAGGDEDSTEKGTLSSSEADLIYQSNDGQDIPDLIAERSIVLFVW